jgi:hypothetical protein
VSASGGKGWIVAGGGSSSCRTGAAASVTGGVAGDVSAGALAEGDAKLRPERGDREFRACALRVNR